MGEKIKIEFISEGFKQILESGGTQSLVKSVADDIASRAGEGFEAVTKSGGFGGGRWIGFVESTTDAAAKAESEEKVLSGAVM